jgi:hypothetical protein
MDAYKKAYGFLSETMTSKTDKIYDEGYLLEHYEEINFGLGEYLIDYLPLPMTSEIYSYEFDHDHSSVSAKRRENSSNYFEAFRRFLFTILGYSKEIYLDTTFLDDQPSPQIFQHEDTLESVRELDNLIITGLQGYASTIISLPDEKALLMLGTNILVETNNQPFMSFLENVSARHGLYVRKYNTN